MLGASILILACAQPATSQTRAHDAPPAGVSGATHPGAHSSMSGMPGMHDAMDMPSSGTRVMLSYRYMRMNMAGTRDGTTSVADPDVVAEGGEYGYMVAPTRMPMDMHMAALMLAPSDRVTFMIMGNWRTSSMDHMTRSGSEFTTRASGLGDTKLVAVVGLSDTEVNVHLNAGISLPTGSIDEADVTPASAPGEARLPYPMQIGSGTIDLEPGVTVHSESDGSAWGLQTTATLRLGENDSDYTLGNRFVATGWFQFRLLDELSASVRVEAQKWGNVDGADPALNPGMIYTADPDLRAGTRIDVPLGFNWYFVDGPLHDHRLAVEVSLPVYQDLDGPQLERDWVLTVGWQKGFQLF